MEKKFDQELPETKVFRDPIHKSIHVKHQIIWELIDTYEFQRLRRIRQLGGTFQVYPTAEHSRFTHSLGVYEILRRMVNETELKQYLDPYQSMVVMISGLLHDIGHGPFSHTFEHVFDTKHEEYTVMIIESNTRIKAILDSYHPQLVFDVCHIIAKTHPNKLMVSLVSSHIDADRMDYLLRDAYFCGVSYGQFDLERLLRTMRVSEDDNRVVYKKSGSYAIEDYLFARYHMYLQVYMHPVSLAFDQMLTCLLKRARELYLDGYTFRSLPTLLEPFFKQEVSVSDYLALDDAAINVYIQAFSHDTDVILASLAKKILNRDIFEMVVLEDDKTIENLKQYLSSKPTTCQQYQCILVESSDTLNMWLGRIKPEDIKLYDDKMNFLNIDEASNVVSAILNHDEHTHSAKVYLDLDWYLNNPDIQNILKYKKDL